MPNPFAHVELSTDDVKKAKKFYLNVFGWKLNDLPDMGYTMIDVGGGVGGGIQKKQAPEAPAAWLPYVQVDDVKATIAKAVKAGGKALLDYQAVGEMGAIAIFVDPAGATLGLWEAKEAPAATEPPPPPAKKAAAKKAPPPAPEPAASPAKKAPAKKASTKKAAAPTPVATKKAPAPAKKAPAKKAPAKKR